MRIAFLSQTDPASDMKHWSGIDYHLYHALARHADVIPVQVAGRTLPRVDRAVLKARRRITGKRYRHGLHPHALRDLSRRANAAAQHAGADVALGGQGYFTHWDARAVKGAIFSDTLYGAKVDFYGGWERASLDPLQLKQLRALGQQAIANVEKVFLTSAFAFERAAAELDNVVPAPKRCVTHIGANLGRDFAPPDSVKKPPLEPLNLLWVGMDWPRKGGPLAVEVVEQLAARGLDARLHIVGHDPGLDHAQVVQHGMLRKWISDERDRLIDLYRASHLFLFPTRADMCSAVLAEAAALHTPGVASYVGGLTDLFEPDQIAFIDVDNFVSEATNTILRLVESGEIAALAARAHARYRSHLNWDHIAQVMVRELESTL